MTCLSLERLPYLISPPEGERGLPSFACLGEGVCLVSSPLGERGQHISSPLTGED